MPTLDRTSNGYYWYPTAAVPALVEYLLGKSIVSEAPLQGFSAKVATLGPGGTGPNAVDWVNALIGGYPGGPKNQSPIQVMVPADLVEGGPNQTVTIVSIASDSDRSIETLASTPAAGIVMSSTFMKAPANPVSAWANDPRTGLPTERAEGTNWKLMLLGAALIGGVVWLFRRAARGTGLSVSAPAFKANARARRKR